MRDEWKFERKGNAVHIYGMAFGSNPQVIVETKRHVILKVPGYMAWNGYGQQRRFEPTTYYLVQKTSTNTARRIKDAMPGARWRTLLATWKKEIGE